MRPALRFLTLRFPPGACLCAGAPSVRHTRPHCAALPPPPLQNTPRTDNYHKLLWHLCLHPMGFTEAAGNRDVQEVGHRLRGLP